MNYKQDIYPNFFVLLVKKSEISDQKEPLDKKGPIYIDEYVYIYKYMSLCSLIFIYVYILIFMYVYIYDIHITYTYMYTYGDF
jgi:hypothetical protein